jgi:hypothetical protein
VQPGPPSASSPGVASASWAWASASSACASASLPASIIIVVPVSIFMEPESIIIEPPESIFIIEPESIFIVDPESLAPIPPESFAPLSFAPASWELGLPPLGLALIIIIILGAELEDDGIEGAELSLAALPESVLPLLPLSLGAPASVAVLLLPPLWQVPLAHVSEQQSPKSAHVAPFALHAVTPQVPVPPSPMLQSWLQQSAALVQTLPLGLHTGAPHVPLLH